MIRTLTIIVATLLLGLQATPAQDMQYYIHVGDSAMQAENFQEAIVYYQKALALDADSSDYLTAFQMGICYQMLGDNLKEADAYKESILRGNTDPDVLVNMKSAFNRSECKDCLKNAYVEIKTHNPAWQFLIDRKLYSIYVKEKDWKQTIACAKNLLNDPDIQSDEVLTQQKRIAQCYLNQNNIDSAQVYFDHILAVNPQDADTHKAMGMGYYNVVQTIITNSQNAYSSKKARGQATQHDYAMMQTEGKRATLKYFPIAKEHLLIANKQLNDPNIASVIQRINNNLSAYQKK